MTLLLTLDLQYFAEGVEDTTQTDSLSQTNRDVQLPVEENFTSSTDAEKTLSLTQTELDALIKSRLERERKKFEDYNEVKKKAAEYESKLEEQRLAELSEIEKAHEQARKFEEQLQSLTAQLEAERTKAQTEKRNTAISKVASSLGIIDVEAVLVLADLSAVGFDDNGEVVGVEEALTKLVENKPYLVAQKSTQPIGQSTNNGSATYTDKSADQLLADAKARALKTGRVEDRMEYAKLKKQLGK